MHLEYSQWRYGGADERKAMHADIPKNLLRAEYFIAFCARHSHLTIAQIVALWNKGTR